MSHMDVIATAQGRDKSSIGARFLDAFTLVDWRRNVKESFEEFTAGILADSLLRTAHGQPMPHTVSGFAVMGAEAAAPVAAHIAVKTGETLLPILGDSAMGMVRTGAHTIESAVRQITDTLNRPNSGGGCIGAHCAA